MPTYHLDPRSTTPFSMISRDAPSRYSDYSLVKEQRSVRTDRPFSSTFVVLLGGSRIVPKPFSLSSFRVEVFTPTRERQAEAYCSLNRLTGNHLASTASLACPS